jgi:hypothetical protein
MLGIGLHSYGFMDKTLYALLSFISFEVLVIAFALIWPAINRDTTPKAA